MDATEINRWAKELYHEHVDAFDASDADGIRGVARIIEAVLADRRGIFAQILEREVAAERERWKPARVYFERYCQDEAEDAENCVCGQEQHDDAKAFAAAIRGNR